MRSLHLTALLLGLAGCLQVGSPAQSDAANGSTNVTTSRDQAAELLKLPDDEYFAVSEDRLLDLQEALSDLFDDGEERPAATPEVLLGAPDRVSLDEHEAVPILVGTFETGLRAWQVNLRPNLHFFARDPATGALVESAPLISMRRAATPRPSGVGEPPDEPNATSTTAGVTRVDLLEKMAGRLHPGRIRVTAIVYDIRSNTVEIELAGETGAAAATRPAASPFAHAAAPAGAVVVPASGSASAGIEVRFPLEGADAVASSDGDPVFVSHLVLVRLDEPPVVIPVVTPVGDGSAATVTVSLGASGHAVEPGDYRVYIETGTDFQGPFPLTVEP